jgi:hypothetical protein
MYTIRFATMRFKHYDSFVAQAVAFDPLFRLAEAFAPCETGVIVSKWFERNGRYVIQLFDWCECCCTSEPPVWAEITAPAGFDPGDDRSGHSASPPAAAVDLDAPMSQEIRFPYDDEFDVFVSWRRR